MTKLVIDIPDDVILPPELGAEQQLLREAREIVGMDRRTFEEMLGSYGVAMQDEEDLGPILDDIETFRH